MVLKKSKIYLRELIFSLICFLGGALHAQKAANLGNQQLDSLKIELKAATKDTLKLPILDELIIHYMNTSTDSCDVYLEKGIQLAREMKSNFWTAIFTYRKAGILERTSGSRAAIAQYLKALPLHNALRDTTQMFLTHSALISRYQDLGNTDSAFVHYQAALSLLSEDNPKQRGELNNRIGIVYAVQQDYPTALRYWKKNLPIYHKMNHSYMLGATNMNIGIVYDEMNLSDSALIYLERGLHYYRASKNQKSIAINLGELAAFHIGRNEYQESLDYLIEALDIIKKINAPTDEADLHEKLTNVYTQLGNYEKAIFHGEKGLAQALATQNLKAQRELYKNLAQLHGNLNNFEKAWQHEKQGIRIQDSIFTQRGLELTKELEQKYQAKEKDAALEIQNLQLSKQQTLLWSLGVIISLLILILGTFWKNDRRKKRHYQQLQQLDKAKSRFFANISHELRTPLTLILAPIENAVNRTKSLSIKEDLKMALNNSKRLLSLVNEILDLSKLESGTMSLHKTSVHFEKLVRRIFFSYHSLSQLRGLVLSFSYHLANDLILQLDVKKFEKVIHNLLSNAFKHSLPGGIITLRAMEKNGHVRVEVQDTGRGIPKEELEKIFERFYQVEDDNEPIQGGTGIGLAYAREIAKLFHGDLGVESIVGMGSTFIFQFPMKKGRLNLPISRKENGIDEMDMSLHENRPTPLLSNDKSTVLIVEDNFEMKKFLVDNLSPQFNCITAFNGEEAIEILADNTKIDLITSDIMMPGMDGFELIERIKNPEIYHRIPVILLTARALEEDKLKGLRMGVDDYITKPFSTDELIVRIQNLLDNKHDRQQHMQEYPELDTHENEMSNEERLLELAKKVVLENLDKSDFKVANLATSLNYSSRQLERVIKRLTGYTPVNFIREIRLIEAYKLIEKRQFATIAEVRYSVGIENASYFNRRFLERFGKKPSEV